jgi:hypothetical protein
MALMACNYTLNLCRASYRKKECDSFLLREHLTAVRSQSLVSKAKHKSIARLAQGRRSGVLFSVIHKRLCLAHRSVPDAQIANVAEEVFRSGVGVDVLKKGCIESFGDLDGRKAHTVAKLPPTPLE